MRRFRRRIGHTGAVLSTRVILGAAAIVLIAACAGSDDEPASSVREPAPEASAAPVTEPSVTEATGTEPPATEPPLTEPPATELPVVTAEAAIEPSEAIGLAASLSVELDRPARVEVTAQSGDHVVEVPRTAALTESHAIPVVGMRPERTYEITATFFTDDGAEAGSVGGVEFTTSALPPWFAEHELTIDADRAAPGYTIVEFDTLMIPEGAPSSQYLIAYDNEGEVVWYYTNTGALGGVEQTPAGTFNMFYWPFGIREVDILGNVIGNWRPVPPGLSADEVDDEAILAAPDPEQVQFQGGAGALAGRPGDAEPILFEAPWIELNTVHHEAWPMPNGNILTLSTTLHELTPEQRATFCPDDPAPFNAISDVALELQPDGTVLRTWDLWDAIDIDEHPGDQMCIDVGIFQEENTRDWTHANSVVYDPARDAIIISSRHTNQIVAFDHLDDEGPQSSLRWILGAGGTIPLAGDAPYYQHAVEVLEDGSIVVYDNGYGRPGVSADDPDNPLYSRAVIYAIDDASDDPGEWSATQLWEHIDTEDDGTIAYTYFIGDADVLSNGNVLITHGGIGTFPPTPEDPLHILIREIVPDGDRGGDVVWELKSEPDSDSFWLTYRAERIPSFYFGPDWVS